MIPMRAACVVCSVRCRLSSVYATSLSLDTGSPSSFAARSHWPCASLLEEVSQIATGVLVPAADGPCPSSGRSKRQSCTPYIRIDFDLGLSDRPALH